MVAAIEKGIDQRIELVRSVVPTDDFDHPIFEDNPLGKIPTLVTNEGPWFDSSVVLEKMDLLVPEPRMFPPEPEQRVIARVKESLADGIMETMVGWLSERFSPSGRTDKIIARSSNKLTKSLDYFESQISELSGGIDAPSISLACALSYLDFRFSDIKWRDDRANLSRWHSDFSSRRSMHETEFKNG